MIGNLTGPDRHLAFLGVLRAGYHSAARIIARGTTKGHGRRREAGHPGRSSKPPTDCGVLTTTRAWSTP
jgi:hypothetical protein